MLRKSFSRSFRFLLKCRSRTFYTVKTELPPLVTSGWLSEQLGRKNLKVVDGSWHLSSERNAAKEFSQERIPGATFFDIDEISDKNTTLPHMMPNKEEFEVHMSEIGLKHDDIIIVYDTVGIFSAPRVWYTLKTFGAKNVAILDGGFPLWKKQGYEIEEGPMKGAYHSEQKAFSAKYNNKSIADLRKIKRIISGVESCQIVDARSKERFNGLQPDPREKEGVQRGHIPTAINLPFTELLTKDKYSMKPVSELKQIMKKHNIDIDRPVVTMCGSGITACIISFALHLIQWENIKTESDIPLSLYDGSWAEWGKLRDTPKVSEV